MGAFGNRPAGKDAYIGENGKIHVVDRWRVVWAWQLDLQLYMKRAL